MRLQCARERNATSEDIQTVKCSGSMCGSKRNAVSSKFWALSLTRTTSARADAAAGRSTVLARAHEPVPVVLIVPLEFTLSGCVAVHDIATHLERYTSADSEGLI